ncbi:MAG: N-6 DNA methylase [Planctomycetota bacterium]|nr:N-6 DNA methylase [Planctomycetota bacterium]
MPKNSKPNSIDQIFKQYQKDISETYRQGDAREESYYPYLKSFLDAYTKLHHQAVGITVQPKKTIAGIPDFLLRGKYNRPIGYVEAKDPETKHLSDIADTEQLKRYRESLPNVILTNFLEFQLYRDGKLVKEINLPNPFAVLKMKLPVSTSYLENLTTLLEEFFSYSTPATYTAKQLAIELAKRTKFLNDIVLEELKQGNDALSSFYNAFQKELIESLTEDKFADMYAQTITYGLFSARIRAGDKEFTRKTAYEFIPPTITLLRDIFYFIIGPQLPESLEWIVDDIVGVLANANLSSILKDFHTDKWTNDPVIHFYETFLEVYNPKERERLGVYYTPEPVVSYIVHSIHLILKKKFNQGLGLAGDSTVKLLDPAAGTLTFPAMAIRLAYNEIKHRGEGYIDVFIKDHILKNFYAFEILVAPYAIGHFKISVVLEDLGYKLKDNERFNLYLTNTLEMKEPSLKGTLPGLTEETKLAKKVKDEIPIMVVLGNPPYSVASENKSEFIEKLMETYKQDVKSERNVQPLSDDYIKFIRFAQYRVEKTGQGIIGMITNNSYLGGLIHRGMRKKLLESFDEIYILNLHGSSRIGETAPDGSKDENVFDIMQGVSIALFVKKAKRRPYWASQFMKPPVLVEEPHNPKVYYADLYGTRDKKYDYLLKHNIKKTKWQKLKPVEPHYFFTPKDFKGETKYHKFWSITDIFKESRCGAVTGRDHFLVGFTKDEVKSRLLIFTGKQSDEMVAQGLNLKDTRDWKLSEARQMVKEEDYLNKIYFYAYRPFDNRFICYALSLFDRGCHRFPVMKNLLEENIALVVPRKTGTGQLLSAFISDILVDKHLTGDQSYFFPLYLYDDEKPDNKKGGLSTTMLIFDKGKEKYQVPHPNFKPEFLKTINETLGKSPSPEEIFYYIYGVLYSPTYRKKYEEFLKIDFPRIPITSDYKLFQKIGELGKELVELHLLKSSLLDKPIRNDLGKGNNNIEKVIYEEKKAMVYINPTQYFNGISKDVWEYYIGGYPVLDKYLKSRKGRMLTKDEIDHFLKTATAIKHTIELQEKIDKIYPETEKNA